MRVVSIAAFVSREESPACQTSAPPGRSGAGVSSGSSAGGGSGVAAESGANAALARDRVAAPLAAALAADAPWLLAWFGNVNCTELGDFGPCEWRASYGTTTTRAFDPGSPDTVVRAWDTSASYLYSPLPRCT